MDLVPDFADLENVLHSRHLHYLLFSLLSLVRAAFSNAQVLTLGSPITDYQHCLGGSLNGQKVWLVGPSNLIQLENKIAF